MSLKFAAVGNLMALSAFENHALVEDRFKTLSPIETYDPLLAMIGRGRRTERRRSPSPKRDPPTRLAGNGTPGRVGTLCPLYPRCGNAALTRH